MAKFVFNITFLLTILGVLIGILIYQLVPILLFAFHFRRTVTRYQQGRCTRCGYDMEGLGFVCPECGPEKNWPKEYRSP